MKKAIAVMIVVVATAVTNYVWAGGPCCEAAAAKGKTCFKCNPDKAVTCCEKSEAKNETCEHPCCKDAAAKGETCTKCNPPKES